MPDITAMRIAWRYLRSKKSHSAVSAISIISVCGMAVAAAAMVCVLSVFNGFREVMVQKLDTVSPDVVVTPAKGKVFAATDSLLRAVEATPGVAAAMPALTEQALVIFNSQESPINLKGVDFGLYSRLNAVKSQLLEGSVWPGSEAFGKKYPPGSYEGVPSVFSVGVASRMHIYLDDHVLVFAPRREGRINLANPAAGFLTDSLVMVGVARTNQPQFDDNTVITSIASVRDLFQYDTEASSIEVGVEPGADPAQVASGLRRSLGPEVEVKDRFQQQEVSYRMVSIEKWVSFLLLSFILLIACFNILSSMSMLVLEKQKALHTLRALGMSGRRVGRVFFYESLYVAGIGAAGGVFLGVAACLAQERWGLIRLGGDPEALLLSVYPVSLEARDLWLTAATAMAIGLLTALVTAAFARSRSRLTKIQ